MTKLKTIAVLASWSLALVLALLTTVQPAAANGAPVTVNLIYLPGLSNWGPTDASGLADVVLRDESVYVQVSGLPHLRGEAYEVWLANTAGGAWLSVGRFNTDDTGSGDLDADIALPPGLPEHPYDLVLITVEPEPDADPSPSTKVSLAGYFPGTHSTPAATATTIGPYPTPKPGQTGVGGASTAIPALGLHSATGTPGLVPSRLPKTGEPAPGLWLLAVAGLLLLAGGAARAAAVRVESERRRR